MQGLARASWRIDYLYFEIIFMILAKHLPLQRFPPARRPLSPVSERPAVKTHKSTKVTNEANAKEREYQPCVLEVEFTLLSFIDMDTRF